jgi:CMP-N-acetylneuraminic acid synthetase
MSNILAFIPARGGSKGIPRKNLADLGGHPLVAWAIATARDAGCFSTIAVSTDDEEIASVALRYGAEVPAMRPADISGDRAVIDQAMQHMISHYASRGVRFDAIAALYPTHPFRTPEMVASIARRACCGYSHAFTARPVRTRHMHYFFLDGRDRLRPVATGESARSYNTFFRSYGLVQAFSLAGHQPLGKYVFPVTDATALVDIDTDHDLETARHIVREGRFAPPATLGRAS